MKRQPDRIPRDRSDTMTAMGRNQEVITRFQVDSLGTWLAVGMDRLKSEGLSDEQRANFLLSLERGSLSEKIADNGFHGMD
jgi:hypothetical protein